MRVVVVGGGVVVDFVDVAAVEVAAVVVVKVAVAVVISIELIISLLKNITRALYNAVWPFKGP